MSKSLYLGAFPVFDVTQVCPRSCCKAKFSMGGRRWQPMSKGQQLIVPGLSCIYQTLVCSSGLGWRFTSSGGGGSTLIFSIMGVGSAPIKEEQNGNLQKGDNVWEGGTFLYNVSAFDSPVWLVMSNFCWEELGCSWLPFSQASFSVFRSSEVSNIFRNDT